MESTSGVAAFIKELFVGGVPQGWRNEIYFFYSLHTNSDGTCERYYIKTMLVRYCIGLTVRGSTIEK